jgi:hypothetical protein
MKAKKLILCITIFTMMSLFNLDILFSQENSSSGSITITSPSNNSIFYTNSSGTACVGINETHTWPTPWAYYNGYMFCEKIDNGDWECLPLNTVGIPESYKCFYPGTHSIQLRLGCRYITNQWFYWYSETVTIYVAEEPHASISSIGSSPEVITCTATGGYGTLTYDWQAKVNNGGWYCVGNSSTVSLNGTENLATIHCIVTDQNNHSATSNFINPINGISNPGEPIPE